MYPQIMIFLKRERLSLFFDVEIKFKNGTLNDNNIIYYENDTMYE